MKKLSLLISFLAIGITSTASAESISAVDLKGKCQIFSSQAQIPAQFKVVSSCKLIKDAQFGSDMDQKMKDRLSRILEKKREAQKQKPEKVQRRARPTKFMGSGHLTKRGEYTKRNSVKRKNTSKARRSSTQRNYASRYNKNYQKSTTQNTKTSQRRPAFRSSTEMKRSGYLKSPIKYSDLMKDRDKRQNIGEKRIWKGYKQMSRKKEERTQREVKLKRLWKGSRLEGEISK